MDPISLTQKLIAIPSEAGPNQTYEAIATFIHRELQELGIESKLVVSPSDPEGVQVGWDLHSLSGDRALDGEELFCVPNLPKYNVVGEWGQGEPVIIVHAHLDTVPCPNPDEWDHPPFGGVITEEKLYGLGAADSKSGIAIAIAALCKVKEQLNQGGTVKLVFTADEEVGGYAGAGYLVKEGLVEGDLIFSTNGMMHKINMGCWGRLWAHLHLDPDDQVLELFRQQVGSLNESLVNADLPVQIIRMSYGEGRLELVLNLFSMIGFDSSTLTQVMKSALGVESLEVHYDRLLEPQVTSDLSSSKVLAKIVEEVTGERIQGMTGSSSDLRFFLQHGISGLAFGPIRSDSQIHNPNEHVLLEDLQTCTLILEKFILEICEKNREKIHC